jgi:Tfp pilus assembly protein PilX
LKRLREDEGWALMTAMILLVIMAGMALATFAYVDAQQTQSATGRKRETAFNLAEATLNAQIFALSRDWAGYGAAGNPYPTCTPASTSARCPSTATLTSLFASPDTASGATWTTEVHDNQDPTTAFYSDQTTRVEPGYDRNKDGKVWVRAQATARGKTRTLIALVGTQEQVEDLPHAALISGRLDISNNGHKVIVDAYGGTSVSGLVAVRCTPALLETTPCMGHKLGSLVNVLNSTLSAALSDLTDLLSFQVSPNVTVTGYVSAPSLSTEARLRLRARAIADGTYYATCPVGLPAGDIVYIESGDCSYQANATINSASHPGVIIMGSGKLTLDGTIKYYGVIYNANLSGSVGEAVHLGGDVEVHGGVLVDGQATTVAGSSHINIQLDDSAYNALKSYGSAGIIQNTFREIKGS